MREVYRTLLVVAEKNEALPLIKHYEMKESGLSSIDMWSNDNTQLIITGPGVSNVISSLSKAVFLNVLTPWTNVINVGYAGAKGLNVGRVVTVRNCYCLEFPKKANVGIENGIKLSNEGYDCYTSFDFVEKNNGVYGAALFDMELAYIARFMYNNLCSIKIVSDNLYYDGFKKFDGEKAWQEAIQKIEERRKIDVPRHITT